MSNNNSNQPNFDISVLVKLYETNRSAIMSRVSYRDYCLMLYIGAAVALLSAAISKNNFDLVFGIPFLSLGALLIIGHHHFMINAHSRYIVDKLAHIIKNDCGLEVFDTFHEALTGRDLWFRCIGEFIFLILPSVIVLILVWMEEIRHSYSIFAYVIIFIFIKIVSFSWIYGNRFNHNFYVKRFNLDRS